MKISVIGTGYVGLSQEHVWQIMVMMFIALTLMRKK